jgi:hypothetical protein
MRPMINLHHEFDPDWAGKFRNVGRPRNRSSGPWLFGPTYGWRTGSLKIFSTTRALLIPSIASRGRKRLLIAGS